MLFLTAATLVISGCQAAEPPRAESVDAGWRAELDEWKVQRDERLRRPTGWLSLAGLYWLEDGENTFGSDPASDLLFPSSAPRQMGVLRRSGDAVTLEAQPGVELFAGGETVSALDLLSDAAPEATVVEHGTLSFYVIERGDRLGVRLKDTASPLLAAFEGMDYFAPDPGWRIEARFELYDEPKTIQVPNIIGGSFESTAPGVAVFEIDGREVRLEPTGDPARPLFFVFGDETNGETTYGGGRFLYAGPPADDGSLVLDFNRAYNPPCVFTPYATCPLPRPEDQLAMAVEAGEKRFGAAH